jgi:hypothetical protein
MNNSLRPVLCRAAVLASAVLVFAVNLTAQAPAAAPAKPRLPLLGVPSNTPAPDPNTPPASTFHDPRYGVTFQVPVGWTLTRHDAEVSTFAFDVRTAPISGIMRGVATIAFNPHPTSTFSGALFYFSVTPRTTEALCRTQASAQAPRTVTTAQIAGTPFTHGYDEHGTICTESRDEIYTAYRNNSCYRFDLVINTFCGGDVSGVRDITPNELNAVRHRLDSILGSVTFDTK